MTVTITGTVVDATSRKDSRGWRVWSPVYRQSVNGEIITITEQPVRVHAGLFTAELEPGVAVIQSPDGDQWTVTIPETDADLWDIISAAVGAPPDTSAELLAAAIGSFVETAGIPWSSVNGKPSYVAAGSTQSAARNVIGATSAADVSAAVSAAMVPSTVTYTAGLPATETIPLATGGNLVKTYHYDSSGNPTTCDWNFPTGTDYVETFTYDSSGNATGSTFA